MTAIIIGGAINPTELIANLVNPENCFSVITVGHAESSLYGHCFVCRQCQILAEHATNKSNSFGRCEVVSDDGLQHWHIPREFCIQGRCLSASLYQLCAGLTGCHWNNCIFSPVSSINASVLGSINISRTLSIVHGSAQNSVVETAGMQFPSVTVSGALTIKGVDINLIVDHTVSLSDNLKATVGRTAIKAVNSFFVWAYCHFLH